MIEVIGVRFKPVGKVYYFDPKGLSLKNGDKVIVETVRGLEIGDVVIENREVPEDDKFMPLSPVIRVATEQDLNCLLYTSGSSGKNFHSSTAYDYF